MAKYVGVEWINDYNNRNKLTHGLNVVYGFPFPVSVSPLKVIDAWFLMAEICQPDDVEAAKTEDHEGPCQLLKLPAWRFSASGSETAPHVA